MSKIYAIGVGGSGSKCIESLVFLHSIGMFGKSKLGIVFVDADSANGNTQRARTNLRTSDECQKAFGQGNTDFMAGEFRDYGVWNPLAEVIHSTNLEQIFNREVMCSTAPQLGNLFDALYSPSEQQADLNVGFRGRPPIGSAIMSRLELKDLSSGKNTVWGRIFDDIHTEVNNGDEVAVHLFGSVFGGTGASGVPTLAKMMHMQLQQLGIRDRVHINATPLLPYFGFSKPEDGDHTVFAETRFFGLNTQAALQYLTEHSPGVFDTVYLLGNVEKEMYEAHTGGTNQHNDAHFIELYAGLSVADGLNHQIGVTQSAYISRASNDQLTWDDLPVGCDDRSSREYIGRAIRFTYSWLFNFSLELNAAKEIGGRRFAKGAPWFPRFYRLSTSASSEKPSIKDEKEQAMLRTLDEWAKAFLTWAQQISSSHSQGEQLFQLKRLQMTLDNRGYEEKMSSLIINGPISQVEARGDCVDRIKNKLADKKSHADSGIHGLVHSLYTESLVKS